jgi:DNA-binding MarR family transcriptional regulator
MARSSRPSPARLRNDAERLHAALNQLVRVYQLRDRDTICCHDVSVTQCNALELLVERGPLRSLALADALMLDKSTTTRVVDALERKGYVERRQDPSDARAHALTVTRAGRALYERINERAGRAAGRDPARPRSRGARRRHRGDSCAWPAPRRPGCRRAPRPTSCTTSSADARACCD